MERRSVLSRSVIVVAVLIGIFVLFSLRRWNIDHPRRTPRTVKIPNAIRHKFAESPHKPELIATAEHGSSIKVVAFSPVDASLVASASVVDREARTIKLWRLNDTDKPVEILGGSTFAFSPDGRFLAIANGTRGTRLWHIDEKKSVSNFGFASYSYKIAFSPDGQWLANDSLGVKLWDVRTPTAVTAGATLSHEGTVKKLVFSPDGKLLATAKLIGGDVTIWDVESQQVIKTLKQDAKSTRTLKFSSDMKNLFLAIADNSGSIELYAFPDWHLHATIATAPVHSLAFTLDGKMLVSGGIGDIEFWSLENGERIATIEDSTGWVNSVAFSADETALASGWSDGVLRVWDISQYMNPQESVSQDIVRLIYFLPSDRHAQPDVTEKLDKLIKEVQQFYADQMEQHGLGRKTFTFEKNEDGSAKVYLVEGQYTDKYYLKNTFTRVEDEVNERFDRTKAIHLIAVDISSEGIGNVAGAGGITPFGLDYEKGLWGARGGRAVIPASGDDGFNWEVLAHELGHAFGLKHDFRDPSYLMSYGRAEKQLSECSAQWLDKSHYFNPGQPFFDEPLGIEIGLSSVNLSKSKVLQFHLKDVDGLHQAMLFTPPTVDTPLPGYQSSENAETNKKNWENTQRAKSFVLQDYRLLDAQKEATVEFSVPESLTNYIKISMIDVHGNITFRIFDLSEDIAELVE